MFALADSSKRWQIVLRCTICGPLGLLFNLDSISRSMSIPWPDGVSLPWLKVMSPRSIPQYTCNNYYCTSDRIAWNASYDCPLSEYGIPLRLIGAMVVAVSYSNNTLAFNELGFFIICHLQIQFGRFIKIQYTFWIIWRNYLPINGILSFTIYMYTATA